MLTQINDLIQDIEFDLILVHIFHYLTGRNVIIFEADMNSSVHIDNKGKDILIFSDGPTQGLDDSTLTIEVKYSINFTQSNRKFCLR